MINLIHLSDIHYIENVHAEQKKVLSEFILDLKKELKDYDSSKTFLIISGDIAKTGSSKIYDSFQKNVIDEIKKECGISYKNMIFVPGNHDVDREFVETRYIELESFLTPATESKFNDYLNGKSFEDSLLKKKFDNFANFYTKYICDEENFNITGYSTKILDKISVFCLNSALCSFGGFNDINDAGNEKILNINTRKIQEWLDGIEDENIGKILVMHHPIEYLSSWSQSELKKMLKSQKSIIVLTGHTHEQDLDNDNIQQHNIIYCKAPQFFCNNNKEKLGYSIINIDETKSVHSIQYIKYREWFNTRKTFDVGSSFAPGGIQVFSQNLEELPEEHFQNEMPGIDYEQIANDLLNNNSLISDNYIYVIRALEQLKSIAKFNPEFIFDFLCKYIRKRASVEKSEWYVKEIDWLALDNDIKVLKSQPYDVQLAFNILYRDCEDDFKNINKIIDFRQLALQNISFSGMNVKNTDFSQSLMQHANMFYVEKLNLKSKFENCKFDNTFLDTANMARATFINCSFINTNLRWANMYGCVFDNSHFNYCRMTGTILSETHIRNCLFDYCNIDASEMLNLHFETKTKFNETSFCFSSIFSESIIKQVNVNFINCNWAGADTDLSLYEKHGRIKRLLIYKRNINSKDKIPSDLNKYSSMNYTLYKEMKYFSILKILRDYCLPNGVFDEVKEIKLFISGNIEEILK
jgi:uncharacterized protein YjbI with pentapeptide repeats/predicted phosphodiesterase|nr:MAG TPA: pentapeptide repeat protein [Caudoviricetes sp.]